MVKAALFLDRDGIVNKMHYDPNHGIIDSPLNPKQFFLMPGIEDLIKVAKNKGYKVIIVSNQPAIAKGKTILKNLELINKKMYRLLKAKKAEVNDIIYCLHHPEAKILKYRRNCQCRKPKPGMLLNAAKKYDLDLKNSIIIGDGVVDIQAGQAVGCKTVLVANDKIDLRSLLADKKVKPDFIVNNIEAVIKLI